MLVSEFIQSLYRNILQKFIIRKRYYSEKKDFGLTISNRAGNLVNSEYIDWDNVYNFLQKCGVSLNGIEKWQLRKQFPELKINSSLTLKPLDYLLRGFLG